MALIFLDIDGVIATDHTYAAWRRAGSLMTFKGFVDLIDPALAGSINQAAMDAGAGIVVSSMWRHREVCPYPIGDVLHAAGITAPIVGQTPVVVPPPHFASKQRGYEINAYLQQEAKVPLDQIVIIDDDLGAASSPKESPIRHGQRVIQTNTRNGITPKQVLQLRKMLGLT